MIPSTPIGNCSLHQVDRIRWHNGQLTNFSFAIGGKNSKNGKKSQEKSKIGGKFKLLHQKKGLAPMLIYSV